MTRAGIVTRLAHAAPNLSARAVTGPRADPKKDARSSPGCSCGGEAYDPHERRSRAVRQAEHEFFVVKNAVIPEGHERLTRLAATGLSWITRADLAAMRDGVRRPDTEKLTNHVKPAQQRRHALRRDLCQPVRLALRDIRSQLVLCHRRALAAYAAGHRSEAFGWIGEALHLIQDSYAPAHVLRTSAGGRFPIVYIRYYGLAGEGSPREHKFPFDPRDFVSSPGSSTLFRWAGIAVMASRDYLVMAGRHLASPGTPFAADLRAFLNRHLILSAHPIEPTSVYPIRCKIVPKLPIRL